MREQNSFANAFNEAKVTVAKWEQAQGFEPSEPQWAIGKKYGIDVATIRAAFVSYKKVLQHRLKFN